MRALTALLVGSTSLLACYGTEVPAQKPAEDPLSGAKPVQKTDDATKREDRPGERKASTFDKPQTQISVNRGARQAAECAKIHAEGPFGDFKATVMISSKGKIDDAVLPAPFAGTAIGKCVEKAFEHEMVPPWEGPDEKLEADVSLKKPKLPMSDETAARLRVAPPAAPFHVALLEPEIPQNTGSIARLCAATCSPLHLVGRLGFRIDEKAVRRAGLDYWHLVDVRTHVDLAHLAREVPRPRWHLFSARGGRSYLDADFSPGDLLLFGKESVGLPDELAEEHEGRVWGIPTSGGVRSLNLSTAVGIVLFEALRKAGALDGARLVAPG